MVSTVKVALIGGFLVQIDIFSSLSSWSKRSMIMWNFGTLWFLKRECGDMLQIHIEIILRALERFLIPILLSGSPKQNGTYLLQSISMVFMYSMRVLGGSYSTLAFASGAEPCLYETRWYLAGWRQIPSSRWAGSPPSSREGHELTVFKSVCVILFIFQSLGRRETRWRNAPQEDSTGMVRKMHNQSDLHMLWIMSFKRKTRSWLWWKGDMFSSLLVHWLWSEWE